MCRWLAYHGAPIRLEEILFKPEHSLIDQSLSSKSKDTPTNGDGFGVGWYGGRTRPGRFRSLRPAWNDFNLHELAAHIESPQFLAHVRATSLAPVQETNCHPFRYGRWLFVHNGEIDGLAPFRRDLYVAVAPRLFNHIEGSTDSELMFSPGPHLRPRGRSDRRGRADGGICRADGPRKRRRPIAVDDARLHRRKHACTRSVTPPTATPHALSHQRHRAPLSAQQEPARGDRATKRGSVVSEPIGNTAEAWVEIPQNTAVTFPRARVTSRAFPSARRRRELPRRRACRTWAASTLAVDGASTRRYTCVG